MLASVLLSVQLLAAAPAAAQLTLRDSVTVSSPRIQLADVAESGSAALGVTDLGATPLPGYSLRLSRHEIARLLRARGLAAQVAWQGASSVRVERLLEPFDSAQLLTVAAAEVRARLGSEIVRTQLEPAEPLPELQLPAGQITLRARPLAPAQALRRKLTVWIEVLVDGAPLRTVPVRLQLRAYRQVLTAAQALPAGVIPPCAALTLQEVDVAGLDSPAAGNDCGALQGRLKRALAAGAPLLSGDLQRSHAVTQGENISLVLQRGAIVLESRAVAMADGDVGQRIEVKPSVSAAPVSVDVIAPGMVRLAGDQ